MGQLEQQAGATVGAVAPGPGQIVRKSPAIHSGRHYYRIAAFGQGIRSPRRLCIRHASSTPSIYALNIMQGLQVIPS